MVLIIWVASGPVAGVSVIASRVLASASGLILTVVSSPVTSSTK